jgi:hypothetical protein
MNSVSEITENELLEIEALWNSTTKGPWKSYIEDRDQLSGESFILTDGDDIYLTGAIDADQDFIAYAHEIVPKLILEIRRLRALLKNIQE